MSSNTDSGSDKREIRLEMEVAGTPDEVWRTIATGPGISSWFVPAEVEEWLGGAARLEFAPGFVDTSEITAWDPPRRLVYQGSESGGRQLAFEWSVEARSGDTCVVRLVNSGFLTGADWDAEYESMGSGWRLFLQNLRLVREHFPGQPCAALVLTGEFEGSRDEGWLALCAALGISAEAEGAVHTGSADAPPLAGRVVYTKPHARFVLTEQPAPGIAMLAVDGNGPTVYQSIHLYLFGPTAAETVAREDPAWRAWLTRHFKSWGAPAEPVSG